MTLPSGLDAAAFTTFEHFPLRWRFTDRRNGRIAPQVLERLRPLTVDAAGRIAGEATARCAVASDTAVTFRTDDSPGIVSERIRTLPIAPTAAVVVAWDSRTATVTDWEFFAAHWDDFCYPASDDVTIWAPGEPWTVCYWHFEVMYFDTGR